MPMPVSVTRMCRKLPSTGALSTTLPCGVYLMALPTRVVEHLFEPLLVRQHRRQLGRGFVHQGERFGLHQVLA